MTSDAPARGAPSTSPLPAPLRPLGALEPVYRWAVARRNASFDRGERVWRAPVPVVSVGNLSVGGTGKTPVVARFARELVERGLRPALAMRGYGRRTGELSDEEAEYRDALPDVPVLANPDRASAIAAHVGSGAETDCVLLDDGFQHRFVARDFDVVLLDATRDPFRDACLPRGRLREPVDSLVRADAVVITRADRADPRDVARIVDRARAILPAGAIVATCIHRWACVEHFVRPRETPSREPVERLGRGRVFILSGIGNPAAFRAQVESSGATVVGERALPDHARYTASKVDRVLAEAASRGATEIVTTAKDWVKIRRVIRSGAPDVDWLVPRVDIEFLEGGDALLERLFSVVSATRPRARAGG